MPARVAVACAVLLLAGACGEPENGPLMRPGENCMSCHAAGEEAASKTWTVAGTVFDQNGAGVRNAKIELTDADSRVHVLTSNAAGNFYSAEPMKTPFQGAALRYEGRTSFSPHEPGKLVGSCNACHAVGEFPLLAP